MLSDDKVEAPVIREVLGWWTSENTVVAVIGAYKGDTVAYVRKHSPAALIYAYEPQRWACAHLQIRFGRDDAIALYDYGLGTEDGVFPLYEYGTDACTFLPLPTSRNDGEGELHEARRELKNTVRFNFAIVNIEGYEYFLLPHIATQLLYTKILVQEHRGLWPEPHYPAPWWGFRKPREIGSGWVLYS